MNHILLFVHYQKAVVLDIEGTTTPITFVSEILFPYARKKAGDFLDASFDSEETQGDIEALRAQVSGTGGVRVQR